MRNVTFGLLTGTIGFLLGCWATLKLEKAYIFEPIVQMTEYTDKLVQRTLKEEKKDGTTGDE